MLRYCLRETWACLWRGPLLLLPLLYGAYTAAFYPPGQMEALSLAEYLLVVLSDRRYYLIVLLAILTVCLIRTDQIPRQAVLLRSRSFFRFFLARSACAAGLLLLLLLEHTAVASLVKLAGISLGQASNVALEASALYRTFFSSPPAAVICTVLYFFSGCMLYYALLSAWMLFLRRALALFLTLAAYLLIFLRVQTGFGGAHPLLFLDTYLYLPDALRWGVFPWSWVMAVSLCALIFLLIERKWWWSDPC